MSGYDYAGELLGGSKAAPSKPPAAPVDYADELLGPRTPRFSEAIQQRGAELDAGASFGSQVKAGMVDDPRTKMRLMAESIFPGETDAVERFGVHNGEIVYVGKDDKLHRAEPSGIASFAANTIGNLPTIAGGTAGAIAGAPAGAIGSIGLGALGAAGGKGIQEIIANLALGEPQTVGGNIGGMAKEAAFAGGGSAGGAIFQKWLGRNVARDVSKFDPNAVAALDDKAKRLGVDLNVAQRTNVPSLKGRVEALSRIPQSADDMNTSLERTRAQAAGLADDYVSGVSPTTQTVSAAGEAGRAGAKSILERIATDRATQARPLYEKALRATIDPRDETLQRIADTPAFKTAWERAKRIAANEGIELGDSASNMKALHYVKLGLDDLIEKGGIQEGVGSTEKRAIVGVKNRLLELMDKASPEYARARFAYGHFMPTLEASREGLIGQLANLADTDLHRASRLVFSPQNSVEEVRKLRSMFFRYDQGEQWKALTKGYLQDTLEQASREFKSGAGAGKAVTWRYMLMGDLKQAANLRAAMTPEQWQGFGEMMDVFEAVGRTSGRGNSITMPMQEAFSELKKESGGGLIGAALSPRQKLINWLEEARLGKHAEKQVEILNDPNALKRLKELKQLSPTDKKFIQGFSTLFGVSASPE